MPFAKRRAMVALGAGVRAVAGTRPAEGGAGRPVAFCHMASHTEEQKVFIVRRVAVFDAPEEIIADFKRRWKDTDCQPDDIAANDPRRGLSDEKLLAVFNSRRAVEMRELDRLWPGMPETLQIVLRGLSRDYQDLRSRRAYDLANKTAEQIAKIESGYYANKTGKVAPGPGESVEEVTRITRTIIDPPVPSAA